MTPGKTTPPVTYTCWQRFDVSYDYPVVFSENLFDPDNEILLDIIQRYAEFKSHRVLFFVDQGVAETLPDLPEQITTWCEKFESQVELACAPVILEAGERLKSDPSHIQDAYATVSEHKMDRHSFVIGIGGGALLDAIGLVAATAHRGIRHIRIPTTVLAQNDSGVGVKNAVNLFGQKNYLGTFAPPFAVLNDYRFIEHLPEREKTAGIAEAVKVALIRDVRFFDFLEDNARRLARFEKPLMQHAIQRCAELHMNQIAHGGDPFELGSARPLDFGHWIAHRLEILTDHQLRHGEAVAIGLAVDTRYSVLSGLLSDGEERRVTNLLMKLGFDLWHPALEARADDGSWSIMKGLDDFQEHLGGELTITLLESLGQGVEVHELDATLISESIMWLKQIITQPDSQKIAV